MTGSKSPNGFSRLARMQGTIRSMLKNFDFRPTPAVLSCLAAVAALAVAGCGAGSDDSGGSDIPASEADQMQTALTDLQGATAHQDCDGAKQAAQDFTQLVDNASVDSATKSALSEGANQVNELVDKEVCTPTGTTDTSSTTTSTTEPTTTEPTTTTETTTTEETTPKPSGGENSQGEEPAPPTDSTPGSSVNGPPGPSGNSGEPSTGGVGAGGGD
jgi:hypothetical protein